MVADALGTSPDGLDPRTRLDAYGMDSLTGTQFFATLQQTYDVRIPPMELLGGNGTITGVAHQLRLGLGLEGKGGGDDAGGRRDGTESHDGHDGHDGHGGDGGDGERSAGTQEA
ncbi:acyl carrier protein [Streptomyces mobaraensis]|uniref:acyl carrier protein n=1 Tax=Streptomyces mobaraensis TaxID=35621 RepID=UPI0033198ADF